MTTKTVRSIDSTTLIKVAQVESRGYRLDTSEKVAKRWVQSVELMDQYANQAYTIRYEDLVTDPQTILTDFSKFLEVDPQGFAY